ncbi:MULTISPECIES: hypothetical protein [Photorhabdus]|uniref:Uncharacterized protein n=1 Tax=Photorhabdus bodei TaxID=2029681 RepID=A0AAW6BN93_9GAMM|nr:hypothetical protein [Photorhabdus bodei]MCC8464382.1 hypothetical protein [Photorhabdus bodei]MDB6374031.1 hypothetical protein [Photorhabdus bodei]
MTGVSECSQQRGNLKDDGYKPYIFKLFPYLRIGVQHLGNSSCLHSLTFRA